MVDPLWVSLTGTRRAVDLRHVDAIEAVEMDGDGLEVSVLLRSGMEQDIGFMTQAKVLDFIDRWRDAKNAEMKAGKKRRWWW